MVLEGEPVTNTDEARKGILEYLNNAPDLSNFEYSPWTDETRNKVMNVLSQFNSPGKSIEVVTETQSDFTPSSASKAAPKAEAPKAETPKAETAESNDNLDDFINGLDL